MLRLYNAALWPARAAVWVWSLWSATRPERREEVRQRLGNLPAVPAGGLWIHGASVGEARVVALLAAQLRRHGLPLSVSAMTRTGRAALPAPPDVAAAFFLPFDVPRAIRRALSVVQPGALVLVETELWPNLLHEALEHGVRVVLANARLSPERSARYRRWRSLWSPMLARVSAIGAQSEGDARRFVELGAAPERVTVTGNIKYDAPLPRADLEGWRSRLGLGQDRPVFVAGSTRRGEEAQVLDALSRLRRHAPLARLVIAPRRLERIPAVRQEIERRGWRLALLSAGETLAQADVLLVDQMGILPALYGLARAAFVGGTLVPAGGHNVLEPAAWGVPVLFGPYHGHVEQPARALLDAGGARLVRDAEELAREWMAFLDEANARRAGEAARAVVEKNRGALERTVRLVEAALGAAGGRR